MDLMEDGSYEIIRKGRRYSYRARFDWVEDSPRLRLREGDIIKFNNSIRYPSYARNQLGIILRRYKWTKFKSFGIYRDYGAEVKMLSGRRTGYIRRFYQLYSSLKVDG